MLGCGPEVQTARGNGVLEITYDHCAKGGEVEYYRVRDWAMCGPAGRTAAGKMGRQAERQSERDQRNLGILQDTSADTGAKPIHAEFPKND